MEFFQQFLNKARQGYGQVDKNVFGGLLPGGAATPIGAALQGYVPPKGVKPIPDTTRRMASLVDAATGAIAGAQPFVEKTIKSAPDPVQGAIASGLNALPFSVNLFSRYYTGLGDRNLQIPEEAMGSGRFGMKQILDRSKENREDIIKERLSMIENTSAMLNDARLGKLKLPPGLPPGVSVPSVKMLNDVLAEEKSNLNRIKQGDIPFDAYQTLDTNPLTSPATSFGRLWFKPTDQGYQAKEKYDFVYGGMDQKAPMGPVFGPQLTPTQDLILNQMLAPESLKRPGGANFNRVTDFARAIVGKMPDRSFEYLINVR
jgi:hypothetical protein